MTVTYPGGPHVLAVHLGLLPGTEPPDNRGGGTTATPSTKALCPRATPEELNARHVKGVKLLFLPSADLKRNLEGLNI
jgi:hypothetical protein